MRTDKEDEMLEGEFGVYIDWDKCNYCLECVDTCLHDAILLDDYGELTYRTENCTLAECCRDVCTEKAIILLYANGEARRI